MTCCALWWCTALAHTSPSLCERERGGSRFSICRTVSEVSTAQRAEQPASYTGPVHVGVVETCFATAAPFTGVALPPCGRKRRRWMPQRFDERSAVLLAAYELAPMSFALMGWRGRRRQMTATDTDRWPVHCSCSLFYPTPLSLSLARALVKYVPLVLLTHHQPPVVTDWLPGRRWLLHRTIGLARRLRLPASNSVSSTLEYFYYRHVGVPAEPCCVVTACRRPPPPPPPPPPGTPFSTAHRVL